MARFVVLSDAWETLQNWARLLASGISIVENVSGFEWEGQIAPGEEKVITHNLKVVPTRFILTSARGTNQILESEARRHTDTFFFVRNVATSSTFIGKIKIMP